MANYVVDSLADETDGNISAGHMSLREAVALANATAGADTITFAEALAGQTITLTLGAIGLSQDVTIDGDSTGDNKADITDLVANSIENIRECAHMTTKKKKDNDKNEKGKDKNEKEKDVGKDKDKNE